MSKDNTMRYLGIDAGGTFTDFVLFDGDSWRIHKVLSTPDNPANAILQGIDELHLRPDIARGQLCIIHGSTVATNAALEGKGARTVYLSNKGFKDVLTIGRQARRFLYDLNPQPRSAPVPAELCVEVNCRRNAKGEVIEPLFPEELDQLKKQVEALQPEAIAINLLFSYLNDSEEKSIEALFSDRLFVSRSSFVLAKQNEYERGIATWLNASLGPKVYTYMSTLSQALGDCPVSVMQSTGGTISIDQASKRAVNLLLSGPAGGLSAIRALGKATKRSKIISFDMGGTSTDIALMDGDFQLTEYGRINDWPVAVPMLEMHTIGAGGGSIAWVDEGGLLHVGPQSAGAFPGPACYKQGGKHATVTDANLVLGRLKAEHFLGGSMRLSLEEATKAIGLIAAQLNMDIQQTASGILMIAEQQMCEALNVISIQKGHNPAEFTLCCFGGAGGLHVCSLAEKMAIHEAIIPQNSGVLSALGMLSAPKIRQLAKTLLIPWGSQNTTEIEARFKLLESQGMQELIAEGVDPNHIRIARSVDLRYQGQSFTLNVSIEPDSDSSDIASAFATLHTQRYGHVLSAPVELVNICVSVSAPAGLAKHLMQNDVKPSSCLSEKQVQCSIDAGDCPIYQRAELVVGQAVVGPAIIADAVSTVWLKDGWQLNLDPLGNLLLKRC